MKKNFLEEQIKSKNKIDYSFDEIKDKIFIEEKKTKLKFDFRMLIPALGCAIVCLIASIGLLPKNGNPASSEGTYEENSQTPGGENEDESPNESLLVGTIPQVIYWNDIKYNIVHDQVEENYELDEFITHLINQEDLESYNKDYPLNTPIVSQSIYDLYLNNRVEVYSIKGIEVDEMFAIKCSFDTFYFISNKHNQ